MLRRCLHSKLSNYFFIKIIRSKAYKTILIRGVVIWAMAGVMFVGGVVALLTDIVLLTSTYANGRTDRGATSKLRPTGFHARISNGRASLFILRGGGNVRIYVAGFNKHVMSIVIPSGSNIVHSIILNFSSVRSCVGFPSSFNTAVKHCTGHVGRNGVAISKMRCRLPHGGCNRYLRKNPGKCRCRIFSTHRLDDRILRLACLSGSKRRNFPNGLAYGIAFSLASSSTVSVHCDTRASHAAIIGVAGRSCFGLSNSPSGSGSSCLLAVSTSTCAPISDAFVAASRVISMRNASVSFHAPATINTHVSGSFRRLGGNGNCSRG